MGHTYFDISATRCCFKLVVEEATVKLFEMFIFFCSVKARTEKDIFGSTEHNPEMIVRCLLSS